ncbi:LPS biosynthesis protein [Nocardioides flavus (ex Wang et al. 2016)]|uniref:LPS biosynthesis protein n=1 Tax=Nocardioides flavus (ex Wang et al. 2016) TaxID=2058780 RepID=A0ABQ3HD36_9ACTN|nr:LPS biosynthesis protein [Nocardioides flavus (ex Wang et al. 2016)]
MLKASMLLPALVAALASWAATVALVRVLPRLGLVDRPNARSSHSSPVPRGGGLAVLVGVVAGLLATGFPRDLASSIAVAVLVGLLGLADDRFGLEVRARLLAQCVLALLAVALVRPQMPTMGLLALLALALSWVAFVNAMNFMDGINGISAAMTIVVSLWFVLVGEGSLETLAWATAASAFGFLLLNSRGKVFLGDVGSYALGSLIWSMTALALASGTDVVTSFAPMSLYGLETAAAMLLLMRRGGRPGEPHRLHAYQRWVDSGLPHLGVAFLAAGVLSSMLLIVRWVSESWIAVILAILVGLAYVASPAVRKRPVDGDAVKNNSGKR